MRRIFPFLAPSVLVAVLVAVFPFTVFAGESVVQVNPELRATWATPDADWHGRTVLLLHGFASERDEAGGLFRRLADALARHGVASLRIDFRGEGDAKRTQIESTLDTRLEDAAAAYAYVLKQDGVDAQHVGVLGWSLGATTAVVTGGRHPDWFRTMCVWSGPSGDQFAMLVAGEMHDAYVSAERDGTGSVELTGWKTVTLHKAFFDSFRGVDVDKLLTQYPGAFLSVRGSADFLPQADSKWMTLAPGRPCEAVLIGGADHIFHVLAPDGGQSTRALDVTVAWFERTL